MAHVIPVESKGSVLKILIGVIVPQPLPEMTPRIFIFSIVIADYSFYVKSISTCALTFFGYIISVLTSVLDKHSYLVMKGKLSPCLLLSK